MATNPFVVSLLARGASFADREDEVEAIAAALTSPGGKLVVYGDRRLGKSSALDRAAESVRRGGGHAAIASFATASESSEAAQRVLAAAQSEIGSSWREMFEAIGSRVRAGIEITPSIEQDGMPTFRFRFGTGQADTDSILPDVLNALDEQLRRRRLTLGLGLDEFQRIHEWGGEDAEWSLREALQRHASIGYVLAGSKRHLIEAMVGTKGRALWKLADVLRFGPIEPDVFAAWIDEQFAATGVSLPDDEAAHMIALAGPRTRDVVLLARTAWTLAKAGSAPPFARAAFEAVVRDQAELYRTIFLKLTARQQSVLRAFAADSDIQITSAGIIRQYDLGPKSSVQSTVQSLVEDEHLTRADAGGYGFDDPYFRRWVQVHALPDIGVRSPAL